MGCFDKSRITFASTKTNSSRQTRMHVWSCICLFAACRCCLIELSCLSANCLPLYAYPQPNTSICQLTHLPPFRIPPSFSLLYHNCIRSFCRQICQPPPTVCKMNSGCCRIFRRAIHPYLRSKHTISPTFQTFFRVTMQTPASLKNFYR